jgi:hypothetical protein
MYSAALTSMRRSSVLNVPLQLVIPGTIDSPKKDRHVDNHDFENFFHVKM